MDTLPAESLDKLASALAKAQLDMPVISLDSKVKYKDVEFWYASLSNIIYNTRPHLAKNGLSILQFPSTEEAYVTVETMLLHESGQRLCSRISARVANPNDPKLIGSMITYLRRYAYGSVLGISLDGDYDGEVISEKYTGLPDQKRWLFDTLQPMGVDKATMAKVATEMQTGNYEMNEQAVAAAVAKVVRS